MNKSRGGGRFQLSLVLMLEQRIAKHTLNSVLKISKTGTLFTVFPTKSTPFHYVLSLYFTPNHSVFFFFFVLFFCFCFCFVLFFVVVVVFCGGWVSDLRKPTLSPLKCHFSYPRRWQRCALPSSVSSFFSFFVVVFFCFFFGSSIGTKLTSKRPPPGNKCIIQ